MDAGPHTSGFFMGMRVLRQAATSTTQSTLPAALPFIMMMMVTSIISISISIRIRIRISISISIISAIILDLKSDDS